MLQQRAAEKEARAWESQHKRTTVSVPKSPHVHCPDKKVDSEEDSGLRLKQLETNLNIAMAWNDKEQVGEALYNLAEYFNDLGMLETAHEYYERSFDALFAAAKAP